MKGWLREPLVHFLGLGALLFILNGMFGNSAPTDPSIVVSEPQIARLAQLFSAQWQRPPTREELDGLVEQQIREEVLYREAVALGLDQNDTIVRRRMVQKLEFLSQDLVDENPSETDLRTFFEDNAARFLEPAVLTFAHVYLNPDDRGDSLSGDAALLLADLRAGSAGDTAELGDTFLLPLSFAQRSQREVAGLFGADFAADLTSLEVGSWQGPIASGYGLHLVLLAERVDARVPDFGTVRDKVRTEYLSVQRREADETMYQQLRERYRIDVVWPSGIDDAGGAEERPE